jgi:FPC/CPF motif-containing protein YcgG
MIEASHRLYFPQQDALLPFKDRASAIAANPGQIFQMICHFMTMKNYPCVAALQSFAQREFLVGIYPSVADLSGAKDLRQDLLYYLQRYRESYSQFLSFWAVFPTVKPMDEDAFEQFLWEELTLLTSEEARPFDRDTRVSDDPKDPSFCLSLGGQAFFVVGMHPNASRISRRFPVPALIFNVFEQFELLEQSGGYETMVKINRARDIRLQKSLNPMVEKYGDHWESIQFSGKVNPNNWRCPFQYQAHLPDLANPAANANL